MSMEAEEEERRINELDDLDSDDDQEEDVVDDDNDYNSISESSSLAPRRCRRGGRERTSSPYQYRTPSFRAGIYDINYLENVPLFRNVEDEDLTDTFASLKSLKEDSTEEQCDKDAVILSKKVCDEFSNKSIPLFTEDLMEDKRLRVMEEEIRINLIGFIELCINQVSAPTDVFKYRMAQKDITTKYGQSLASYNHPVPKFWF